MKTFLLLAFSCSIALAQLVKAEDQDKVKVKAKAAPKTSSHVQAPQHVAPQHVAPKYVAPQHVSPKHVAPQHVSPKYVAPKYVAPQHVSPSRTTVSKMPHINQKTVQANQYHPKVQSTARIHTKPTIPNANAPRTSTTVQADTHLRNKNWQNKNNQNTTVQNQTWHNNSWTEARRRHHREHHDHNWWRSHFTRFALFGSGYYFWDNGYWYPAYGYDSGYNTYDYNEPIYGYNDLDPRDVVSSVQTKLQRLGYYRDAVDGQMGPRTRAAIANYQRDNGLSITSAIDGPTLNSLGLG